MSNIVNFGNQSMRPGDDPTKHGIKLDDGKPRFDLIPSFALEEVARVYTIGAEKYDDNNWKRGMSMGRVVAAALRHVFAWLRGETFDPETGLHHLAHATFGMLAVVEYHMTGAGTDDRFKQTFPNAHGFDLAAHTDAYKQRINDLRIKKAEANPAPVEDAQLKLPFDRGHVSDECDGRCCG